MPSAKVFRERVSDHHDNNDLDRELFWGAGSRTKSSGEAARR